MATTTNYGFETPDDTDLVKDGALSIRTLGQDIDTTLYTINAGSNKVGMHLLNTTTFTTAASVSLNNVFSNSYENYKIELTITNFSAIHYLYLRPRAGGTDLSTGGVQVYAGWYSSSSGTSGMFGYAAGANQMYLGYGDTAVPRYTANIEMQQPFAANNTFYNYSGQGYDGGSYITRNGGGQVVNTSSYDGFTFYPSGGTITGTVRVYGYRNA